MRNVVHLSEALPVNMTDYWHDIASLEHFWVRRRLAVFRALAGQAARDMAPAADVGCGRGLLQSQLEREYGLAVDGFDLDENALAHNVSAVSGLHVYNIHDRLPELAGKYKTIFLFDVLEHVTDELGFLASALHHLQPGGLLYVNLPAYQHLFSAYDTMAGHLRRYTLAQAEDLGRRAGLRLVASTYWGAPYYPLLVVRKFLLRLKKTESDIVATGFDAKSDMLNTALGHLGRLEPLPQRVFGTSVMLAWQKGS